MAIENLITEQFLTVQGEGRSIGRLAYFIRLAGCNLCCEWCDSMHSVDPQLFKGKTHPVDYSKIPANCQLVVITGGEPTLFNLAEIREKALVENPQREFEVESNATNFPSEIVDLFYWNLSPKLKSSLQKNSGYDQKRLTQLSKWAEYSHLNKKNVIFKFVITSKFDLTEVLELVQSHNIPSNLVYLMAEGQTAESQSLNAVEYILDFAKQNGFNFSTRLHIMFWQKKRGV